jgi:hypothetical protein
MLKFSREGSFTYFYPSNNLKEMKKFANRVKKSLLIILILISSRAGLQGQADSLREEILRYPASDTELAIRGRKLTMAKFEAGDTAKVRLLMDYLTTRLDSSEYLAFFPEERWLLEYWTGQYGKIISLALNFDAAGMALLAGKAWPPADDFSEKLKHDLAGRREEIGKHIQSGNWAADEKDFLRLFMMYLLCDRDPGFDPEGVYGGIRSGITQDSLNLYAGRFLLSHPGSNFAYMVREHIRYVIRPSRAGADLELFGGYGNLNGGLGKHFRDHADLGMCLTLAYKDLSLYLRMTVMPTRTKDTVAFEQGVWKKDTRADVYGLDASLGYALLKVRFASLSPFAGIGMTRISPVDEEVKKTPAYLDTGLDPALTHTAGLNLDLMFGRVPNRMAAYYYYPMLNTWFIRLRYTYRRPLFEREHSGFEGGQHSLTLGIGLTLRTLVRDY